MPATRRSWFCRSIVPGVLIRAVTAFLALPGVVAFLIPLLLAWLTGAGPFRLDALVPLVLGTGLLIWCVREFYVQGKGTLAPWAPPRTLVSSGLYRLSRNPMYMAVSLILLGWATGFGSWTLLGYALLVMAIFHLHVVLVEEPWLARTYGEEWKRYAAGVPRWVFRNRRQAAVAWVAAVIVVAIAGLFYEAIADGRAAREFTPPGTLVDIGGRRLHLLCIGDGEPTVIFEPSGWGTALSSARARERIAARTRVCSYDRRGLGWSDPGAARASIGDLVNDLAVLQDRAPLQGPHVIVASSIGGLTAELFARQFPERVAGLVFLDAANSLTLSWREMVSPWVRRAACGSAVAAQFGVIRLVDPFGLAAEPSDEGRRNAALTYNTRPWAQLCAMARGLDETVRAFSDAPPLSGALPVTVLTASSGAGLVPPGVDWFVDVERIRAALRDSHQRLATQSARGRWAMVPDSTHLIGSSQPDAVAEAVLEMLDGVR